ncbi:DUF456 domain-containing protein [Pantanalinema sp. GBBB05]|uniref:DUF456 domain-containing protein n=1 Tax=Pantanalinema sp. GBBB05 TaxID=2604139 RepID=UPI001DD330A0|nr:DUF456 family protein [Pantanalinema sp. GBBB05]
MLILYWCLVAVMLIGIVGAVVPAIPGISLIAIATFVWMLATGFNSGVIAFAVAIVVLGLGILVDFLAGYWGAKQAGASKWGQIGAVVGMVIGILGLLPTVPLGGPLSPVLGIIIGSVLGAAIGEFLYRRDLVAAGKAALGIVVGTLVGNLIQAVLALATMIVFLVTTWPYR